MGIEARGMAPLIQVFDMPTSVRFYRDKLGFTVVDTDGKPPDNNDWVMLRLGEITLMLNTAYESHSRPDAPDPGRTLAHADTGFYFGSPDVDGTHAFLEAQGLAPTMPILTSYGFKTFSLKDPDGFELVFHWPVENPSAPMDGGLAEG